MLIPLRTLAQNLNSSYDPRGPGGAGWTSPSSLQLSATVAAPASRERDREPQAASILLRSATLSC